MFFDHIETEESKQEVEDDHYNYCQSYQKIRFKSVHNLFYACSFIAFSTLSLYLLAFSLNTGLFFFIPGSYIIPEQFCGMTMRNNENCFKRRKGIQRHQKSFPNNLLLILVLTSNYIYQISHWIFPMNTQKISLIATGSLVLVKASMSKFNWHDTR